MIKDEVYNSVNEEIDNTIMYYLDLQDYIEGLKIPKIEYLYLIKNISMFYEILTKAKEKLDFWNANSGESIRKINDFVLFYQKHYFDNDIHIKFNNYIREKNISFFEEQLFFSLICIPGHLIFTDDNYVNILLIKEQLDYIDYTLSFVLEEDKENQKTDK